METLRNNPEHESAKRNIAELKEAIDNQLKSIGEIANEVAGASPENKQMALDELNRAALELQKLREALYELRPNKEAA